MTGEPLLAVQNGLEMLIKALRKDPQALETAYISIIEFNSEARQVEKLKELTEFQVPTLKVSGATAMGASLSLLTQCIREEVLVEGRRDWKPMIFLLTDGIPTDNLQKGIDDLSKINIGTFVACAAGSGAKIETLKKITNLIVTLDEANTDSISSFFKWVSASISISSQKVEQGNEVDGFGELPPPPKEINIIDLSKH
jgi:uncharacterized protein YegL